MDAIDIGAVKILTCLGICVVVAVIGTVVVLALGGSLYVVLHAVGAM